jgi:NitT/TauT family transport system substrate-binding protein
MGYIARSKEHGARSKEQGPGEFRIADSELRIAYRSTGLFICRTIIAAALLWLPLDFSCAAESKSSELKLRIGMGSAPAPALPNSVNWLAKDLGFYKREGLDVEIAEFQGTPLAIAAMVSGDVDVANVSTSDVIRMVATKGQTMRAIHSPDARLYFLIAAKEEIKTVNALQGRTFAVARIGSVDHSLSVIALKALGVNPANITFIAIGTPSTRAQALAAGRVDATTLSLATWVTVPKESGAKVLVDPNTYFETATVVEKVNAVTTKVMQEKPEHLRRFTAAIIKASRHFAENQEAWVEAITKRRPELDRQNVMNLWRNFKTAWAVNGLLNLDAYKKSAEFFYQSGTLEKVPKIEVGEWTETRFVDDVLREIGVYGKFDPPGRAIK